MQLYKINRRPKDDKESDDAKSLEDDEFTYKPPKSMSILLWLEDGFPWYAGMIGTQSYSYATIEDIIIAYNYQNIDKDWFLWLLGINNLSPAQFLWVPSCNKPQDADVQKDEYFLRQIAMVIEHKLAQNPSMQIHLKPYSTLPTTHGLMNAIKSKVSAKNKDNIITYTASMEWTNIFGNKSCLHRFITTPDKLSAFEACKVYTDSDGLIECKGYIAINKDEVLIAYDKLIKELGRNQVVVKDCEGSSGDDIYFYDSKQKIIDNFEWKDQFKYVAVAEDLNFNDDEIDHVEFIGISFNDNKIIGGGHEQIIIGDTQFGGSHTCSNKETETKLIKIAKGVMKKIGTKFMGGFDFAIQYFKNEETEPKIYLIDMNTARYTGTTQTFVIMDKFGINDKYFIRSSLKIEKTALFKTMLLKENVDLLFDAESKRGIYFHLFGPENGDAIISVFGDDEKDSNDMLKKIKDINSLCIK